MKLHVYLFGNGRVMHDPSGPDLALRPTAKQILAFLLLHRNHGHHRDMLAELFWGDQEETRARRCLSTTLWRLRSVLHPTNSSEKDALIITDRDEIRINCKSNYWLDTAEFEEKAACGLAHMPADMQTHHATLLEQAVQLYSGDLLEGCYEDWALRERDRLLTLYLRCLAHLLQYYQHHACIEQSLAYGHKILAIDPLREEVHRAIMRLYLDHGQRNLAIQQYETCRAIIARELGIEPMEETQMLYERIVMPSQCQPQTPQPSTIARNKQIQHALHQLNIALHMVDDAREQIQRALQQDNNHALPGDSVGTTR